MDNQVNKKQMMTPVFAIISMLVMVGLMFVPHSQYSMIIEMQEPGADGLIDWSISLPGLLTTLVILMMSVVFIIAIVAVLTNYFFNMRFITQIVKYSFIIEAILEMSVVFSNMSIMQVGNYVVAIINLLLVIGYLVMDYFFIAKPYKAIKNAVTSKAVYASDEKNAERRSKLTTLESVLQSMEDGEISKDEAYKIIAAML